MRPESANLASAELLVFYAASGDAAQLHKIGSVRQGSIDLSSAKAGSLVEGRPVFAAVTAGAER
jgi:hypothetical protein